MKHFATCLACGFLLPFVWWSEARERRQREVDALLAQAVSTTIPPRRRVNAWIFPTAHGSVTGWRVRAHCVEEAAEILSQWQSV